MDIKNYTLLKEEAIEEMNGTAYMLEHDRTKAKVLLVLMMTRIRYLILASAPRRQMTRECRISPNILSSVAPENFR